MGFAMRLGCRQPCGAGLGRVTECDARETGQSIICIVLSMGSVGTVVLQDITGGLRVTGLAEALACHYIGAATVRWESGDPQVCKTC